MENLEFRTRSGSPLVMRKVHLCALAGLTLLFSSIPASAGEDALVKRLGKAVQTHAVGFEPVGQATIAHLQKKGKKSFTQKTESGWCYRFFAVGEKDSFKLQMRVKMGKHMVSDSALPTAVTFADACFADEPLKVVVSTKAFGGDFIYAVYRHKKSKTPKKSQLGARMSVLAAKHVPGAKLVAVPTMGMLSKGKAFHITVPVDPSTCYKFVAVGGAGVDDVDLLVKSKAQVVSQDATSGDHPVVEYCPTQAGKLLLRVSVKKGKGAVLASVFEAPASTILVGVSDAQTALDNRLKGEAEIYAPDMNMVGIIKTGEIINKKPIHHDVLLAKGVCYKYIAVGGAGIEDLDIQLKKKKSKGNKGVLATDTTDDDAPIASYCAESSGKAVVKLRSIGSGKYSFAVYAGASSAAGAIAGYEELTGALEAAAAKIDKDYKPAVSVKTAVIAEGTDASFDVKMVSGDCYGLLVVGLGDIQALSVQVVGDGNKLGSGSSATSKLFKKVCPGKDVVARVKISSSSGQGPVAFEAYSKPSGVDQVFIPVGGLKNSFIAKRIRKLHDKNGKKRPAVTDLLEGDLQTAKVKTFEVELTGNQCYTILAAGNPSVKELQIKLMSPLGEEVASAKDQGAQVVVHTSPCPKWNGTYKLEVKMFMGYGAFGVQVFGK